jgi:GntR family transcriptional repressor for pyruvate dehydrogenase complex
MITSFNEYGSSNKDYVNKNMFTPQKKETAVDVVISNIKRLLLTRKLLPGDKLPNETDLAKNLNVSRGSIREAMKIFSAFGIVEIKQGDGTYIAKSTTNSLFDPLLFSLILAEPDVEELAEFRQLMELDIATLIIKNSDPEDLNRIENVYLDMLKKVETGSASPAELSRCDLDFHLALSSATKNRLVERTYEFILDFYALSIEKTHENEATGRKALETHKQILDALKEKSIEKAAKAIKNSVTVWKSLSRP